MWTLNARPDSDAGELGQSRDERAHELRIFGRALRREVRRRWLIIQAAKDEVGGRGLSNEELDAVIPPVMSRRTRLRLGLPAECVHGHPLTPESVLHRGDGRIVCRRCEGARHADFRRRRKEQP